MQKTRLDLDRLEVVSFVMERPCEDFSAAAHQRIGVRHQAHGVRHLLHSLTIRQGAGHAETLEGPATKSLQGLRLS